MPPAAPRAVSRDELLTHLHPESQDALPRIRAETLFNPQGKSLGAVSYWIPEIRESGLDTPEGMQRSAAWLKIGNEIPPGDRIIAAQLSELVVFDFLTANPDRYSGGNIKMSPEGDRLYFMDNTMAFFLSPEGHSRNRAWLERTQRYSARLWRALERVTEASAAAAAGARSRWSGNIDVQRNQGGGGPARGGATPCAGAAGSARAGRGFRVSLRFASPSRAGRIGRQSLFGPF